MSAETSFWAVVVRRLRQLSRPVARGMGFIRRLAPASRKEREVATKRANQIRGRVQELQSTDRPVESRPRDPKVGTANEPSKIVQTPVPRPEASPSRQGGEASEPSGRRIAPSLGPFRNKRLEQEVVAIGLAAERHAKALVLEAFQRRGGTYDRRINIPLLVSDLGLARAVELSATCVEALSRDRFRSVFPRPDDAAYEELLRVMEARRWSVRPRSGAQ
jgi:hypothetical protein